MNPTAVTKQQKGQLLFVKNRLTADSNRQLPTRLQIIKAGIWENSWKGDIEITTDDLLEMKLNFNRGVGLPDNGSEGAPVDYSHEDWSKAAFWIKALEVDEVTGILWASEIEWTPAGKDAVLSGEFKFFSPSVYPRSMGTWQNPEDPTDTAQNVLLGGGLTNIPFFKGLNGLNASQTPEGGGKENIIYLAEKGDDMDLSTIRTKKKEELSAEELAFANDHKAELTAEEQLAMGIVEPTTPVVTPSAVIENNGAGEVTPVVDPAAVALQASIKAGTHVVVEKSVLEGLQASATKSEAKLQAMERADIEKRVETHVARGAIKADQSEKWANLIQADSSNEDLLKSLADNPLLASEVGGAGEAGSSVEQLRAKANEIAKTSKDAGAKIDFSTALSQARRENPELAKEADAEIKGNKG